MPQLEIRGANQPQTTVEIGPAPLPVGFDASGRVAWGRGGPERLVGELVGDVLRVGDREIRLKPDEPVEVEGIHLTYRGPTAADTRAAALGEIGTLLWTLDDPADLFPRVLDSLLRVLHIERAAIALFDDDARLAVRESRGQGLEVNPALAQAVLDSGAAILTSEAAVDEEGADAAELNIDVRSVVCAPLRDEGRPFGVLYADNAGRPNSFSNDELDFVSALAHLAAFALANLTRTERLQEENTLLKERLGRADQMILASSSMEEINRKVEKVAGFDATVLITGESGVGKEMVAREVHRQSPRRDGPFIALNCAAIPETLLESELFGYAPQSAIAGADPKGRAGKFEQASGGTIFLDEIGEMKQELQAKLLRVLQDKVVDRINDTVSREVDVRIVVATNQDLEQLAKEGRFREDLYYRLAVVQIQVPPLRARREEIPVLAEYFIRTYPGPDALREVKLSRAAHRALAGYAWPGNVRELKNCIEQALILGDGKTIRLSDLPERLQSVARGGPASPDPEAEDLPPLSEIEKRHIAHVLAATGWNKAKSSRILGISKPTLYEKIRVYELKKPESA